MSESQDIDDLIDAGIAAIQDLTLSPEQVASAIAEHCRQAVQSRSTPPTDGQQNQDTPGLELFLWFFWGKVLELAQEDASLHLRIANVLAALKAEDSEDWRVWGSRTNWKELPLFNPATREEMNGPQMWLDCSIDISSPKMQALLAGSAPTDDDNTTCAVVKARQKWLNMNVFLAQLWALGVVDEAFYGMVLLVDGLEPLTLSTEMEPTRVQEPQELKIEVASVWLSIAGAQMHACREIMGPIGDPNWDMNRGRPGRSGGTWDGVDGYHPDRWQHWKSILQEVVNGRWRQSVVEAAQAAISAMDHFDSLSAT